MHFASESLFSALIIRYRVHSNSRKKMLFAVY